MADIGFHLVGFQSNSDQVLVSLPKQNVKADLVESDPQNHATYITKILGMYWMPGDDLLTFRINDALADELDALTGHPTKRQLLKAVMKIFNPLSLITHVTIQGKVIMQEVWRDGTGWDDKISERLMAELRRWVNMIKDGLTQLHIPRWYEPNNSHDTSAQLHVFCDASERSMGTVAYLRFHDGVNVQVSLVFGKAKVVPLKGLTTPKAELTAAVIAV